MTRFQKRNGFTLIEILIVTAIIGLLAAMAILSFAKARQNTLAKKFVSDLRVLSGGMQWMVTTTGVYPPDRMPGQVPAGLSEYVRRIDWSQKTPLGGYWDWDYSQLQFGSLAGISVYKPNWTASQMVLIDEMIDDGNLSTGMFRARANGYIYEIE